MAWFHSLFAAFLQWQRDDASVKDRLNLSRDHVRWNPETGLTVDPPVCDRFANLGDDHPGFFS